VSNKLKKMVGNNETLEQMVFYIKREILSEDESDSSEVGGVLSDSMRS